MALDDYFAPRLMNPADVTVLHSDPPLSLVQSISEHHNCIDCGMNTNPGAPPRELAQFLMNRDGTFPMTCSHDAETYYVRDHIWKQAGMDGWGGCLCVGCLEQRIGRKLKRRDFEPKHPFNQPWFPRSERLADRLGY
jgi:hypothetical protein